MAAPTQCQNPPRHSSRPSTSTSRPRGRRPRPSDSSSLNNPKSAQAREASATDCDSKPALPSKPVHTPQLLEQVCPRSVSMPSNSPSTSTTVSTTVHPAPEPSHVKVLKPVEPPPPPSVKVPVNQSYQAGILAYPTKGTLPEVCRLFLLARYGCPRGSSCYRIHPVDKVAHRERIRAALDVRQIVTIPATPVPVDESNKKPMEPKHVRSKSEPLQSLLLSNPDPVTPPQPNLEPIDSIGWDSSGSWMPGSKPEAWTETSPALSTNTQLFSTSSDSSSPTTTIPELSEDEKEKAPLPIHSHPFRLPCAVFKKGGTCPRGDGCFFRHIRQPNEQPVEQSRPPEPKKVVDTGKTETPVHVPEVVTPPKSTTSVAPVITPETQVVVRPRPRRPRPQTGRCIKHLANKCAYGYSCRFVHEDLEYDDEPPIQPPQNPLPTIPPPTNSGSNLPKLSSALPKYITQEDEFLLSFTLYDHIRVQCSAGFDIQRLQTAFESSTLLISNLSPRVRHAHLKEVLGSYGVVEDLRIPMTLAVTSVVTVRYSDAAEAQKAQGALNGMKMFELTVNARIASNDTLRSVATALLKDTSVRITWEAPAKEVYAGYSNRQQAERALGIIRTTPLNGHYLRGEIYEGMPAVDVVNVRIHGVPVNVDKADLVRFINPVDMMWSRPNYTDPDEPQGFIRSQIERSGGLEQFEVLPPPYRDGGMIKAWANFSSAAKAKEAARRLDGRRFRCTGQTLVRAKHVQTVSYALPQEKFAKIGAAVEALQASQRGVSTSVVSRNNGTGPVYVRLSADEQKELAHLKNQFDTILKGEVVRCDGKVVWNSYFTRPEGRGFLEDLSIKNPSVHFQCNLERSSIRLFGSATDRVRFANSIVAKVKELRSQMKSEITLAGRLMGAVITNVEFRRLQQQHGIDNAHIDVVRRVLIVRGDFMRYRAFKSAIEEIEQRLPAARNYSGPTCPICFSAPTSPVRLQCSHEWCRDCVIAYFRAATEQKTFPLKCLGNDGRCGTKIPIGVAKTVLTGSELQGVVNAAFLAYIQQRPKDYHYCPTPDCPQVYRTTPQKATLQCPACLTSICTRCHSEAHDESQCADQVQDELFKKWIKEHDVKQCPSCNVPIEKMEGCNHMMCTRCQTHICWQCMKTFPGGEGIYGHMREVHGTFGLGVGFD